MKKICIITGSRAEYGILRPLIEEIKNDGSLELQLLVTGMHLSTEFNLTFQEIEKDGFPISEKIETLLSSDTPVGISKSMGLTIISFSEAYERLKPDLIVVLGDRFEIFSALVPALICGIPVAHIAGGEITQGAFDDALRHSITKMSQIHFTATEEYRKRVIQLGEHPSTVFNVGAPGIDAIQKTRFLTREGLKKELGIGFNKRNLLIVFHPATLEKKTASKDQFREILSVCDELKDTNMFFVKSNADTHGRIINAMIDEYVAVNSETTWAFTSLGHEKYLSLLRQVDGMIGNSSSGIVEAPSLKVGTINIGDRQKGRVRAQSVIDCEATKGAIRKGIKTLYSAAYQRKLRNVLNPYGKGNAAKSIKGIIKSYQLNNIVKKKFYDIKG
ncbi:MAG: UDP-N-acetylglucosamine 2-epimerase (hydrolyzing) [Candidatus Omnitrophica bacterium]|nr:UDP-N-acetylglucosamine 2-epimerase (hydrolyzing) [Candidatus Omnitrophota bacterium]